MEKPDIYEAFQKAKSVVLSCKTMFQLLYADNYIELFHKLYQDYTFYAELNGFYWRKHFEILKDEQQGEK